MTRRILASRVILIATPDDEVAVVAQELARIGEEELRGRVVLHTSGAMDSAVLDAVHERSAMGGSMHPLQSFSGASVHRWKARFLQWKGKRMRSGWRGRSRERLAGSKKILYHAAAAMAAGHVLALEEAAMQLLLSLGMRRSEAVRALLPLTRQVLENFETLGPRVAWTGPITKWRGRICKHCRNHRRNLPKLTRR